MYPLSPQASPQEFWGRGWGWGRGLGLGVEVTHVEEGQHTQQVKHTSTTTNHPQPPPNHPSTPSRTPSRSSSYASAPRRHPRPRRRHLGRHPVTHSRNPRPARRGPAGCRTPCHQRPPPHIIGMRAGRLGWRRTRVDGKLPFWGQPGGVVIGSVLWRGLRRLG